MKKIHEVDLEAVNDLNLKGTYSGTVTPALGGKGVNAPFEKM